MKEKVVSTREFIRNYKKMIAKKNIVIIANHGQPQGVYIPYKKWEKETKTEENKKKGRKFTLQDLEPYIVKGGPKDLSQRVDEICYPYPNKLKNEPDR